MLEHDVIIGSRLCSSLSSLLPILEEKRIEVSKQQRFSTFRKEPASIRHGCIKHCASGGRREDKIGGLAVANLPLGIADGHFLPRRQAFAERRGAAIGERIETAQFGKQSPRGIEQGKEVRGPNFVSSFRTGEFPPALSRQRRSAFVFGRWESAAHGSAQKGAWSKCDRARR